MKTALLVLATLLITCSAYSQDFLGSKLAEIKSSTKHLKGVKLQAKGDSVIRVKNLALGRAFEFRFDYLTHVCYEEDIKLDLTDLKNLNIEDRILHSQKLNCSGVLAGRSFYESKNKKIEFIHSENSLTIRFSLKNIDEAILTRDFQSSNFAELLGNG